MAGRTIGVRVLAVLATVVAATAVFAGSAWAEPPTELTGVITEAGVGPLQGAQVCAYFDGVEACDQSDASGAYSVTWLPDYALLDETGIRVEAPFDRPDLAEVRTSVPTAADGPWVVDFALEPGGRIAVTVVDDHGDPVSAASVGVAIDDGLSTSGFGTGADNFVLLPALPDGEYRVGAQPPEANPDGLLRGEATVTIAGTADVPVEIVLPHGGFLSGTVVDQDGQGVEDVEVSADGFDGTTTGPGGSFVLGAPLPAGPAELRFYKAGYVQNTTADATVVAEVTTDIGEVVLNQLGTVHGTVTGPGGAPVEGATVDVRTPQAFGAFLTTTRADGTYDYLDSAPEGFDPGPVTVAVTPPSGSGLGPRSVEVVIPSGDSEQVDVELPLEAVIDLSITDGGAGAPYAGPMLWELCPTGVPDLDCFLNRISSFVPGPPYRIGGLAAGSYRLRVTVVLDGGVITTVEVDPVTLVAGATTGVPITVGASDAISGPILFGPVGTGTSVSASNPTSTIVSGPGGTQVTINETTTSTPPPSGYDLLGQQVDLTLAPAATPEHPFVLQFLVHDSVRPDGSGGVIPAAGIVVFRNGAPVAACADPTPGRPATPDPCVESRTDETGFARFTVRTSAASAWNFGVVKSAAHTPPSKNACKGNGWRSYTDSRGRPFRNQGDCVSWVSTGGRNSASG